MPKAQARKRGIHADVERVAAVSLEVVAQCRVLRRFDAGRSARLQLVQAALHLLQVLRSATDCFTQAWRAAILGVEIGLLREQADGQTTLPVHDAHVRLVAAGGQSQQARLARTVGANQANPLAVSDGGGDRVENDEVADLSANFVEPAGLP